MGTRALVLGSGGVTGVAWELGLLAGLRQAGLDLTQAEVLVGTSAGSIVATLLATGVDLEETYARQLAPPASGAGARFGVVQVARFLWAALGSRDHADYAARMGRLALRSRTVPEAERAAMIAAQLPHHAWPDRDLRIAAVDAERGELAVFTRASGVPLVQAVTASCSVPAVWPPVTWQGRRYIDGGVHSVVNLHLAAGVERAVALAPMPRGMGPSDTVHQQAEALKQAGVRVAVVLPDAAARQAIGRNTLDLARRAGAARAGRAQATNELAALRAAWEG